MITTILFDYFGTLVSYQENARGTGFTRSWELFRALGGANDYEAYLTSWNQTAERFEVEAVQTLVEYPLEAVAEAFLQAHRLDTGDVDRLVRAFIADWNQGVHFTSEDVAAVHQLAERYRIGVVTNTHLPWLVPEHLEQMGISSSITEVVMSVDVGFRKPHPRMFEAALERMDVTSSHAVFVGDSMDADIKGASRAGLQTVRIDRGHEAGDADCISSIGELAAVLTSRGVG